MRRTVIKAAQSCGAQVYVKPVLNRQCDERARLAFDTGSNRVCRAAIRSRRASLENRVLGLRRGPFLHDAL
jgi:hypothetical protein